MSRYLMIITLLFAAASISFAVGSSSIVSDYTWEEYKYSGPSNTPTDKSGRDQCVIFTHNDLDTIYGFNSGWESGDRIISYYDPAVCDSLPYPFEIQSVDFYLLAQNATYDWPIFVNILFYDLDQFFESIAFSDLLFFKE